MPEYATREELSALEMRRIHAEDKLRDDMKATERVLRQERTEALAAMEQRTHEKIGEFRQHMDERLDTQDVALGEIKEQREKRIDRRWAIALVLLSGVFIVLASIILVIW